MLYIILTFCYGQVLLGWLKMEDRKMEDQYEHKLENAGPLISMSQKWKMEDQIFGKVRWRKMEDHSNWLIVVYKVIHSPYHYISCVDCVRFLVHSTVMLVNPPVTAVLWICLCFSPSNMGLLDPSTSDGRVIFFLPWEKSTMAGQFRSVAVVQMLVLILY